MEEFWVKNRIGSTACYETSQLWRIANGSKTNFSLTRSEAPGHRKSFQISGNIWFSREGKRSCRARKSYILSDVTPCIQVKVNRRFGGTCLLLQGWRRSQARSRHVACCLLSTGLLLLLQEWRWRGNVPSKRLLTFTWLHGFITKKTETVITGAIRTSTPSYRVVNFVSCKSYTYVLIQSIAEDLGREYTAPAQMCVFYVRKRSVVNEAHAWDRVR
jgi:hypothetical protein